MTERVRTGPDPRYLPPGYGHSNSWQCVKCEKVSGIFAGRKLTARGYVCRGCHGKAPQ